MQVYCHFAHTAIAQEKGSSTAGISLVGSNICLDYNELKLALLYQTVFPFTMLQKNTFRVEGIVCKMYILFKLRFPNQPASILC